jgi:hypothetical protein
LKAFVVGRVLPRELELALTIIKVPKLGHMRDKEVKGAHETRAIMDQGGLARSVALEHARSVEDGHVRQDVDPRADFGTIATHGKQALKGHSCGLADAWLLEKRNNGLEPAVATKS